MKTEDLDQLLGTLTNSRFVNLYCSRWTTSTEDVNQLPAQMRAGHLLGIRFADGVPDTLIDRLAQNKIYVSVRGNSIRISPHLYNTAEDIDKLFSVFS